MRQSSTVQAQQPDLPREEASTGPAHTPAKSHDATSDFPHRVSTIATEAQGRFVLVLGVCLMLAFTWAGLTEIDRVTRGAGRIVPQQQKQEVQHLEGGIVSEILIREGDRVAAGQPLIRIENIFFRSEYKQATIELAAKRLRLARLEAETSSATDLEAPADLVAAAPQSGNNEAALFQRRRANLEEQLSILSQQARQKEIELSSMRSRQPLVNRERQIAEERLASLRKLSSAGAVSINEALEAERVLQQTMTRQSDLAHDIPRIEAALGEIAQRRLQTVSNFKAEAERERTQTSIEVEKLTQSAAAMEDRLQRSYVIAPIAGVVNRLNVSTIGGVVKSGESLAEIVPLDSAVGVEMKLSPGDRAHVWPGVKAVVKVSAYDFTVYGTLHARVVDISPDALQDERGAPYFRVRLEADGGSLGANNPVMPGMLADVDVLGERQTVLAAFLRPLRRLKENALRQ